MVGWVNISICRRLWSLHRARRMRRRTEFDCQRLVRKATQTILVRTTIAKLALELGRQLPLVSSRQLALVTRTKGFEELRQGVIPPD